MIRKAFKFRLYPDSEQQDKLAVQFGCSRFVYNHYRAVREEYYHETRTGLTYHDCATDLSERLKADHPWLKDADSQVIQQALMDLDKAYKNFFEKRAAYPKFKRKHDKQAIRYPQRFKLEDDTIYLPKVGWVKAVFHRQMEGQPKNVTVSKSKTGNYFAAVQCEVEHSTPEKKPAQVGIDLGLTTFATFSTGEKIDKPKHFYASAPPGHPRLKIRQRRLSRKLKGSNSRKKARTVVASIHEKIANQRKDFHHKLSRTIVDQFGTVAFESLNIDGMLKNHNLAKAIADAGWNQFVSFIEYKAAWSGCEVLKVDRFFPSSKLCSDCGSKNQSLTLNLRQWLCTECGVIHDRAQWAPENAAINILRQSSVQVLNESTRGARESHAVGDTSGLVKTSATEMFQATRLEAQVL